MKRLRTAKIVETVAIAACIALSTLSMVACQKTDTGSGLKIEENIKASGEKSDYVGDVEKEVKSGVSQTQGQIQNTGDPLKDELSWPIGKFGYHEPPEELRTYETDPFTNEKSNSYRISIYSEKYGNLEMGYNMDTGKRALFEAGKGPSGRLMIISEDNPITNAEALEDLQMGDSIARNFGK